MDVVKNEISGVTHISPVTSPFWNEFIAGGQRYRIRYVLGTNQDYAAIMDLDMITGSFFTEQDVNQAQRNTVISRQLAEILFGSVDKALGQILKPPGPEEGVNIRFRMREQEMTLPTYTIIGIYRNTDELKRQAYGVADMIIPYTALLPSGVNIRMAQTAILNVNHFKTILKENASKLLNLCLVLMFLVF